MRVGIIGCGNISELHLTGYQELVEKGVGDLQISAVCDVAEDRATELAAMVETFQNGGRPAVYADFQEMLSDGAIDAADVCTPPFLHHRIAIACSEAGVHAIVEKPFAITVRAAKKMIDAAQGNDTVLALAENLRWAPSTRACKWLIEEGYIGDVEVIFQGSYGIFHLGKLWKGDEITATPWRHDKLKGGAGYVLDAGAHTAHVFRYINGEIEEAFGATRRFTDVRTGQAYRFRQFGEARLEATGVPQHIESTVEDLALSVLTFANGSLGQYATGTGGHGAASHYGTWIYGSKGCIQGGKMLLDDGTEELVVDFFREKASGTIQERFFPCGLTNVFALELYDFCQAVQAQRSPETDGWEGLKDIAVCYSIVESALLNRPVKVSDVESGEIDLYQREINEHYGI